MSFLPSDSTFVRLLGWAILHSLWQGALIGAIFAVIQKSLARRSPEARYINACITLLLLIAVPVLTAIPDHSGPGESRALFVGRIGSAPGPFKSFSSAISPGFDFFKTAPGVLDRLTPLVAIFWLAGVVFFSLRLSVSFSGVPRLCRVGTEAAEQGWIETLEDLRCRFEIWRPVRLVKSALVQVPTVLGWLRPVILIPATMASGLGTEQLTALIAHELAHLRRFDYVINVCQCVTETLMFYHPAVWWISRRIREEREHCCDELVVQICGDRLGYARALAVLEELRTEMPQLAFAASGGSLLRRIRRLLGVADDNAPLRARQVAGLLMLACGILLAVAGLCLWQSKPEYRAATLIKVEQRNDPVELGYHNPYFIQTEFEVIRSSAVLSNAFELCKLKNSGPGLTGQGSPTRNGEVEWLRSRLSLRLIRSTSILEISVAAGSREQALDLANAIAASYRDFHLNRQQRQADARAVFLKSKLADQEKQVQAQQRIVDDLLEQLKIPDSSDQPLLLNAETVRKLESQRVQISAELARETVVLTNLKELPRATLEEVLPTTVPDNLLTSLLEQRSLGEQALVRHQRDYGPGHPEIVKLTETIKDLNTKIGDRVDGIMISLDQRIKASKQAQDALEAQFEKAKQDDIALAQKARPFFDAKRKLDELQRFAQALSLKAASEAVDGALPRTSELEIIDPAASAVAVYPNRDRAYAVLCAGLTFAFAGLLLARS